MERNLDFFSNKGCSSLSAFERLTLCCDVEEVQKQKIRNKKTWCNCLQRECVNFLATHRVICENKVKKKKIRVDLRYL